MSQLERKLFLPQQGRGYQVPQTRGALPLVYLGWGTRRFGNEPIPLARTMGWVYVVVLKGSPTFLSEGRSLVCSPGSALVLDSDCALGWTDTADASSRVLVWIWRSAPAVSGLSPARGQWNNWQLESSQISTLEEIHRNCRRELTLADHYAVDALNAQKLALDVAWARACLGDRGKSIAGNRFELCMDWMRHNLAVTQPVAGLAAYMDVSEATLLRLFRKHTGSSPLAAFQALKAERAQQLLSQGCSVKEIAYTLGYRHANDLSRFYKRVFGISPSRHVAGGSGIDGESVNLAPK